MNKEINIDSMLRLSRYNGVYDFALSWYQDMDTVKLVDGENANSYDLNRLKRMYEYLDKKGELYFIEIKEGELWIPIGDVTFWQEDMPIIIGNKQYRGKGIGFKVIEALKDRARELGYKEIYVQEIYHYNTGSNSLFKKAGFVPYKETKEGKSYKCTLV